MDINDFEGVKYLPEQDAFIVRIALAGDHHYEPIASLPRWFVNSSSFGMGCTQNAISRISGCVRSANGCSRCSSRMTPSRSPRL